MIHPADVAGCGDEEKVLASGWPAPGLGITSGTADGDFPSHSPVAAAPSLRSSSSARVLRDSVKCSWGASSRIQMGKPLKKDVKEMRPPGSNASTVRAPTLWNSLLRWMLRSRAGKLGSFLHSFLAGVGRGNKPCTLRSVWPLPVPYRFDVYAEDGDEELALQRAVNVMVLVLNWLHLGSPSRSPPNLDASATLTPPQQSVVQRLRRFCQHWIAAGPIAAADMGRTASKIEDLEEQLAFLGGLADQLKDTTGSGRSPMLVGGAALPPGDPTIAKDIEAHRLKFTGVPAFDPRPWMTAEAEVWYDRPLDCALPPEEQFEEVPHVQVKGKRKEILKLLHALDNSNRLAIFPQEDIRAGYQSGMFSLIKNLQKDRLILDSRPANTLEWPLSAFTQCMGSPVPLLDYELPSDCILLASGEDLRDFYYFYVVSNQRAARNCIKFRLSPEEASTFRCKPNVSSQCFYPALATMAMGDVNAVEFGQMSHTLLARSIGIRMEDLLTLRGRVPRQSWMCGLVIDDLIFLEAVPRSLPQLGVTGDLAEAMLSKYDEVGLQANADKRFRGERCSKFWGIFCDGEDGLVRPQVERALPVAMLTAQIARGGVGERKLLETLAGTWTAILQMRRRAMCLLEVIFSEIQRVDYNIPFVLSADCVAELWTLVALAPLFATDLRAKVSSELVLVDASNDFEAEVSATVDSGLAKELSRQKLTKAAWARLLSPLQQLRKMHGLSCPEDEVPEGEEPARSHPLWTAVIRSTPFKLVQKKRIRRRTHINLSELNAALDSEKRRAVSSPDTRLLTGSDSQVVLGALVRGRSSSKSLNAKLKQALPTVLGFNIYNNLQYVPTGDNTADDPTRGRECRSPPDEMPCWVQSICTGNYEPLDAVLAEAGVGDAQVARLPSAPETPSSALDPVPEREKLRRHRARTGLGITRDKSRVVTPPVAAPFSTPWLPGKKLSAKAHSLVKSFPVAQFVFPRGANREKLWQLPGHLDLFSGSRTAAAALARESGRWVLTFDIQHSQQEDLLCRDTQLLLEQMIDCECFLSLTAGPVCASFSRAVRPPVRDRDHPTGLANLSTNMERKVAVGNAMSRWVAAVVRRAHLAKMIWWVENPLGSYLWLQPEWVALISEFNVQSTRTDYCRWGTPYRKRTRFVGNAPDMDQKLFCQCTRPHIRLVGYSRAHGCAWTKVAEPYPTGLARYLAKLVVEGLKPQQRREKLDIVSCAKACGRCIGEAVNPGPRARTRGPFISDLELVDTVEPGTRLIQARALDKLDSWLLRELGDETFRSVSEICPKLRLIFLRSFGSWMYKRGEAMYLFRHLVVHMQQTYPGDRTLLAPAWDLLNRWEIVLPVQHRPPLPRLVLDAMLAISLQWGWYRFACITALAFHGAMRIGEPLRAARSDLVLPTEALLDGDVCFLCIQKPKARRRGKGKTQHSKITDAATVKFATALFEDMNVNSLLYPSSASTYRRRWDRVLQALEIPQSSLLTPGSLRGGGAVHLYHQGVPISDLLWRLRLKHLATLESYLQETAASGVFGKLPNNAKANVRCCSAMLPHLYRAVISRAL